MYCSSISYRCFRPFSFQCTKKKPFPIFFKKLFFLSIGTTFKKPYCANNKFKIPNQKNGANAFILICCAIALKILFKKDESEISQLYQDIARSKNFKNEPNILIVKGKQKLIDELLSAPSKNKIKYFNSGAHKKIYQVQGMRKTVTLTKVIFESNPIHHNFRERAFENEACIGSEIANLQIPGVIPMGIIWNQSLSFQEVLIVTKFCNQKDFHSLSHKMTPLEKLHCLKSIWHTIEMLHRCGYEHGDLHDGNILVHQSKGTMKYYLADFGHTKKTFIVASDKIHSVFLGYDQRSFGDLLEKHFKNMEGNTGDKLRELARRLNKGKKEETLSDKEIYQELEAIYDQMFQGLK